MGQAYYGSRPVEFHSGGAAHFEHQDWEGTERVQTSYNGNIEALFDSLPFGDGYSVSGSDTDSYHFAMLDKDYDSGTDHARFRQYSETEGRWMSPDPYSGSYNINNPQSMNRYSYVENNPLVYVDPDGTTQKDDQCDEGADCDYGGGQNEQYTIQVARYALIWPLAQVIFQPNPGDSYCLSGSCMAQWTPAPFVYNSGSGRGGGGGGQQAVGDKAPNNGLGKYPTRMFGTHWCGPGGAGPTVNNLDEACKAHDRCYDHGYDGKPFSPGSNWDPFQSPNRIQALQQCNQNLCNAAERTNNPGSTRVVLFFQEVVPVGACKLQIP